MYTISRLVVGIAVMIALSGCARQATGVAGAAEAMGVTTLNSIQYSGSGSNFAFGQAASPGAPWPRFVVKTYDVAINYQTPAMKVEATAPSPGVRTPSLPVAGAMVRGSAMADRIRAHLLRCSVA